MMMQRHSPLVILLVVGVKASCAAFTSIGKRWSDGASLKRPALCVPSIDGSLLSEAVVAELEATRKINDFRKLARELCLGILSGL